MIDFDIKLIINPINEHYHFNIKMKTNILSPSTLKPSKGAITLLFEEIYLILDSTLLLTGSIDQDECNAKSICSRYFHNLIKSGILNPFDNGYVIDKDYYLLKTLKIRDD
jgi:hypothetical protein